MGDLTKRWKDRKIRFCGVGRDFRRDWGAVVDAFEQAEACTPWAFEAGGLKFGKNRGGVLSVGEDRPMMTRIKLHLTCPCKNLQQARFHAMGIIREFVPKPLQCYVR